MSAPTVTVASKRVIAMSLKYCENDTNDPMLDLNHRINLNFPASSVAMLMKVAGIDSIIENGNPKKVYHLISSEIKTTDEIERAARRALRKRLKKDVVDSVDSTSRKLTR